MMLLDAAFGHPRGILGRLGGMIMARATKLRNAWTISLLNIKHDDHILEIGFGPGALIQMLTDKTSDGFIAGIDISPLMVQQASKRNKEAIESGRVALQRGSVEALPFKDEMFDKVISANSVQIWPDQKAGVQEIWRVLKPEGIVALVLQPVWAKSDQEVQEIGIQLEKLLSTNRFLDVRIEFKSMKPIASVCVLGTKSLLDA